MYAIVFKGEREYDTFTGSLAGVYSRQYIKEFPFKPKTFYIDVVREKYDKEKHHEGPQYSIISCGDGDYAYSIKDRKQLEEVFAYYDEYKPTLKEE